MTASEGLTNAAARGFQALTALGLAPMDAAGDRWAERTDTIRYGDDLGRLVSVTIDSIEGELLV